MSYYEIMAFLEYAAYVACRIGAVVLVLLLVYAIVYSHR